MENTEELLATLKINGTWAQLLRSYPGRSRY